MTAISEFKARVSAIINDPIVESFKELAAEQSNRHAGENIIEGLRDFTAYITQGYLHRVGGPAWIEKNGSNRWADSGRYHRVNGPAISLADDTEIYMVNGVIHRGDNLPAVRFPDGSFAYVIDGDYRGVHEIVNARTCSHDTVIELLTADAESRITMMTALGFSAVNLMITAHDESNTSFQSLDDASLDRFTELVMNAGDADIERIAKMFPRSAIVATYKAFIANGLTEKASHFHTTAMKHISPAVIRQYAYQIINRIAQSTFNQLDKMLLVVIYSRDGMDAGIETSD